MAYDKKFDGKRSENPMRGAARRTYAGPRVGFVRNDVPRAERVGDETADEKRAYGAERKTYSGNREYRGNARNFDRNGGYDARQPDLEHDEALGVRPAAFDAEDDLQDHRRRHGVAAQQEGGADRGAERCYYQHAPEQTAAAKTAAARRR